MMEAESNLLALPPEVLLRVSKCLTTPELGNFRRTCNQIEATLFDDFAKEFFTKRQFMIEEVSLEALVNIANHPTLSKHLKEVIISTHAFDSDATFDGKRARRCYETGYTSRENLLQTGRACEMLVETFSKLPNLKTIGLRDYNGQGRYRDGPDARWMSYGWFFGGKEANHLSGIVTGADDLFPLVLLAAGKAQARPSNVEVFIRHGRKLTPLCFDAIDGYMGRSTRPVLAGLKTLMLTIDDYVERPRRDSLGRVDAAGEGGWLLRPLKRFLHCTPNLEVLRLNFNPARASPEPLLDWLGEPVEVSGQSTFPEANMVDIPSAPFPKLKMLDLGMVHVHASTLVKVLTKFDGLKAINLWKVTLHCQDLNELESGPSRWSDFLDKLGTALDSRSRLSHFFIGFPTQALQVDLVWRDPHPIRFTREVPSEDGTKTPWDRCESQAKFRGGYGSDVRAWLREMGRRATILDKMEDTPNGTDSEDDESELIEVSDDDDGDNDDEDMADPDGDGDE